MTDREAAFLRMRKCAGIQVQHSTAAYAGRCRRWRHAGRPVVHSVDECGDSVITSEVAGERGADVEARLDRIPASPYLWKLIALLALGGFFEFYELFMTAFVSPGLIREGIFQAGSKGLFPLPHQAVCASVTLLGLFLGNNALGGVADRLGRRAGRPAVSLGYAAA